jgi:hypothetical protein
MAARASKCPCDSVAAASVASEASEVSVGIVGTVASGGGPRACVDDGENVGVGVGVGVCVGCGGDDGGDSIFLICLPGDFDRGE